MADGYWKRKGSGDSRGLQNRRSLSLMAMVGSTPTRFRQFQPARAVHLRSSPIRHLVFSTHLPKHLAQHPKTSLRIFRRKIEATNETTNLFLHCAGCAGLHVSTSMQNLQ